MCMSGRIQLSLGFQCCILLCTLQEISSYEASTSQSSRPMTGWTLFNTGYAVSPLPSAHLGV